MRRIISLLLFVVGGFCVGMQVMMAFVVDPENKNLPPLIPFAALAILFLAPATWLSPGRRWRELGLTMLVGAGVCAGSFAVVLNEPDEQGKLPDITPLQTYIDWTQGYINLAVIVAAGVLLYFTRGEETA